MYKLSGRVQSRRAGRPDQIRLHRAVESMAGVEQKGAASDSHWISLWEQDRTPWQQAEPDKRLQSHIHRLTKGQSSISIFVPFCGKSLDLVWLARQGHSVVGVEISPIGVRQLFEENNLPYSSTEGDKFTVFEATEDIKLKVFVGSMFDLTPDMTGLCDAVWDCRAMVAVNVADRETYIRVIRSILKPEGVILITRLEYDPREHSGPPFNLTKDIVQASLGDGYSIEDLESLGMKETEIMKRFNLSLAKTYLSIIKPRVNSST